MDARILRLVIICVSLFSSTGAGFKTRNFEVTAVDAATARRVAMAAENYRRDLAIFWFGRPLPNWTRPCRLRVKVGSIGAGGETRFQFIGKEVVNWEMFVQGSLERILDSVLPHEVNHTILACHFRRPLPRWADEGAATLFEHRSEQVKQLHLLNNVISSGRGFIELPRLLNMKEYPSDYRAMLTLYAEGYALADFLVQQGGQVKYLKFLQDGHQMGWTKAIQVNYAHNGIDQLQSNWKGWILAGMPKLTDPREEMLAARVTITRNALNPEGYRPEILDRFPSKSTIRSQSPEGPSGTARRQAVQTPEAANPAPDSARRSRLPHATPAAKTPNSADRLRSASFEAPRPRTAKTTTSEKMDAAFTGAKPRTNEANTKPKIAKPSVSRTSGKTQRKHLPQERSAVTGSTPQWAGFPGQSGSI